MKIPNKAYESVFLGITHTVVNFFSREMGGKNKEVRLPKWLSDLISGALSKEREQGRDEIRMAIKTVLKLP